MDKPVTPVKKPKLTPTQAKVIKAKIKAELTDTPIGVVATEVYPNSKPESARVMMHRELQNVTVQQKLEEAMRQVGLTEDALATAVSDALVANKLVEGAIAGTEGTIHKTLVETDKPDHSIRLKAAGMAANWMGVGKVESGNTNFNFINVSRDDKSDYGL